MKNTKLFLLFYYYIIISIILIIRNYTKSLLEENFQIEESSIYDEIKTYNKTFSTRYILEFVDKYDEMQTLYIITPTYTRLTQIADLTRLRNTLQLVPKVVWIIVEDELSKTVKVTNFVERSNMKIVHLTEKTLPVARPKNRAMHKGVEQRNRALMWIKVNKPENGVFYFADDDNSYDLRLFEEIRSVKRIGVWPVGLVGGIKYEKPVCKNDKVIGWFFAYNPHRYFPTDMASFAINVNLLYDLEDTFFERFTKGDLEGVFLKKLKLKTNDLEPKANGCSKIYVWHTKTKQEKIKPGISPEDEILKHI